MILDYEIDDRSIVDYHFYEMYENDKMVFSHKISVRSVKRQMLKNLCVIWGFL